VTGGAILSGWTMIEVFDTAAAGIALARRKLGCPGCRGPLCPWGHARERTVRDLHGELVTARPDRALCPACKATHVILDAGLLPRRAYAAGLIGQALVAAARGSGHRRIALDLDVPAGTVRMASAGDMPGGAAVWGRGGGCGDERGDLAEGGDGHPVGVAAGGEAAQAGRAGLNMPVPRRLGIFPAHEGAPGCCLAQLPGDPGCCADLDVIVDVAAGKAEGTAVFRAVAVLVEVQAGCGEDGKDGGLLAWRAGVDVALEASAIGHGRGPFSGVAPAACRCLRRHAAGAQPGAGGSAVTAVPGPRGVARPGQVLAPAPCGSR
jgi:hypothetical protein